MKIFFRRANIFQTSIKKHFSIQSNIPMRMKAILQTGIGGYETLFTGETDVPKLKDGEVLIKVEAFALNRADILQRLGKYPAPKGASSILGLECSGYLIEDGKINEDKRVMAIVSGGAYAEYVVAKEINVFRLPDNIDFVQAAAIPESWITAYQLCRIAHVKKGDNCLIHAAASGVGTALVQLIGLYEAESICIVSNDKKLTYCVSLGRGHSNGFLRKDSHRLNKILNLTHFHGCSVIFDCVGATEFDSNVSAASNDCRWVCYGFLGGSRIGDFNLNKLMEKRINLHFTTLRNRSDEYKAELMKDFSQEIMPKFASGEFTAVIDSIYTSVDNIKEAHHKMENDMNIGKIVVQLK
jgi:tumor protein p53-inducible protein 3